MIQIDKKKRTHSGSRSKSKKYRNYQYSVDLKGKYPHSDWTKVKTQNSSSVHKSRPSRKNSTKQKKHNKSNQRDHKEPPSHSVSADRRHSALKVNRTQANFDGQDIDMAIDQLIMGLRTIPQPPCANAKLLNQYFNDMRKYYSGLDGPFHRLCLQLHSFYVNPMHKFLQLIGPMEGILRRKDEITKQIDQQIIQNEALYSQLEPIDIEIFKLKEKIEENRVLIEHRRQEKEQRSKEKETHANSQQQQYQAEPEREARVESMGIGKGLKLDLGSVNKAGHMDYHEEFYSKIQEFSESWRDQALREKRY